MSLFLPDLTPVTAIAAPATTSHRTVNVHVSQVQEVYCGNNRETAWNGGKLMSNGSTAIVTSPARPAWARPAVIARLQAASASIAARTGGPAPAASEASGTTSSGNTVRRVLPGKPPAHHRYRHERSQQQLDDNETEDQPAVAVPERQQPQARRRHEKHRRPASDTEPAVHEQAPQPVGPVPELRVPVDQLDRRHPRVDDVDAVRREAVERGEVEPGVADRGGPAQAEQDRPALPVGPVQEIRRRQQYQGCVLYAEPAYRRGADREPYSVEARKSAPPRHHQHTGQQRQGRGKLGVHLRRVDEGGGGQPDGQRYGPADGPVAGEPVRQQEPQDHGRRGDQQKLHLRPHQPAQREPGHQQQGEARVVRTQQPAVPGGDRLFPQPVRVIEEALVGPLLVLVGQVEVLVTDEALGGQEIERFVARRRRPAAGPDVDGEYIGDRQQEKKGRRAERQPSVTGKARCRGHGMTPVSRSSDRVPRKSVRAPKSMSGGSREESGGRSPAGSTPATRGYSLVVSAK